jgi:murein peptide amidase A
MLSPLRVGRPLPWIVVLAVGALHGGGRERFVVLGRSVDGRPIAAAEVKSARSRVAVLVVGCIHGDEPAGIAVARALRRAGAIPGVDLWVIDDLNPDGVARRTRQNGHGVDLNRNFPWRWRASGHRGDQQYPGVRALSEPEARLARDLILRLRPRLTVWFHQPLGITDESGGDVPLERRFASLSRLPLRRLPRYRGSAASWENHGFPRSTAFVVELPGGRPSRPELERYVRAMQTVAAMASR